MKLWIIAWAVALQSCTPVFAQSDAAKGSPNPNDKTAKEHARKIKKKVEKKLDPQDRKDEDKISNTETDKAVFEKKPNEPSTWEKMKEKTSDVVEDTVEVGSEQSQKIGRTLGAARLHRRDTTYGILAHYSIFEMWTLRKYGLALTYNKDESTTYEFEYSKGSVGFGWLGIDLGGFEEQKFALNWRSFGPRNSFSFVGGVYYNILDMHLGSEALATVAGTERAKVDLLQIQTMGASFGIGNRWQTKGGFVWGVDWLAINVPIWIVKQEHPFIDATNSERFREDARDALRFFRRIPEVAGIKIQLGFSF